LLAGLDELREFVATLLEQHIDVGPSLRYIVLQLDQAVVEHDQVTASDHHQSQHYDRDDVHDYPPRGGSIPSA
jgi:hypothetical protein